MSTETEDFTNEFKINQTGLRTNFSEYFFQISFLNCWLLNFHSCQTQLFFPKNFYNARSPY